MSSTTPKSLLLLFTKSFERVRRKFVISLFDEHDHEQEDNWESKHTKTYWPDVVIVSDPFTDSKGLGQQFCGSSELSGVHSN